MHVRLHDSLSLANGIINLPYLSPLQSYHTNFVIILGHGGAERSVLLKNHVESHQTLYFQESLSRQLNRQREVVSFAEWTIEGSDITNQRQIGFEQQCTFVVCKRDDICVS